MSKQLAGTLFCYNGNKYDYSFKEAIGCLLEFCDHVFVAAGGIDGTYEDCQKIESNKLTMINISDEEWESQHGKEKLSHFSNITIQAAQDAGYEYSFNLQSDEIISENSYDAIRKCLSFGMESYMCQRINLWKSPYYQLNVPHDRKPCSTSLMRLAKTIYRSYDDAESISAPSVCVDFENDIKIYHMGFVRTREVMKAKIINMQQAVFRMADYDKKLDECEVFNPDLWFDPKTDLKPIDEPLPKLIQKWAAERVYED